MKKTIVSLAALMMTMSAAAADNCAYSPLQNLIRNVRNANEIITLMNQGVVFSEKNRCGGSLMQLAILRGNPDVLKALIDQDPNRVNEIVELDSFSIPSAPKEIPLILFASYYAPNEQMVIHLVNAGADISKTDSMGRNLLWYMDQNPVLRNTNLYDQLNNSLLKALVPTQQNRQMMQLAGGIQAGTETPAAIPTLPRKTEQQPIKTTVVEAAD